MNTLCQHCHKPTQLYLCTDCTTQLADMLADLVWLLDELDARIQKLDRISQGTVGRSRRPEELDVMDFDAAELARSVRKTILRWVIEVAESHAGRIPPSLGSVDTKDLAQWLYVKVSAIARLNIAGKLYTDINTLVGTNAQGGHLVKAINPQEKHLVGPCPTPIGRHRDGTPRHCGQVLFADTYDRTVTCPACKQDVDVEANRKQAAADRDLQTKANLVELLDNIGEPVTEAQINGWITARRLRRSAYLVDGNPTECPINEHDEPLYSVKRAQRLRDRDNNLRTRQRTHT